MGLRRHPPLALIAADLQNHRMKPLVASLVGVILTLLVVSSACSPKSCMKDSDCGSNDKCMFQVGSCSAEGECREPPRVQCDVYMPYCGCDGATVIGVCASSTVQYASGPTTGAEGACGDGGP